ncbi:class I SAM-dependent methyltransferase [Thalassolituus oleivorans]|uniref:class I SAM-dependent methyltransferase n=1 Tax=Thalassolituus oleivorans TaxID=187493 RepID=UPI00042DC833|nr:class I SAM-dependent methyltransferase [Thalassolituus oleivorans]AHK17562.1 hypothetical protein R615_08540 [Thalassolituus oleivorans R6-15]APR67098.1 hypothetical protein CN03_09225 [Thalassolituus oleivorans]MBQ0725782.1 class I SAM-dependent methyltransferase [Thalassolituus oleivorans]MBQ0779876.1 class I SAM-dependent methyltransferase [Thalassolituus oleivorans]MCA6128642.1 hypothetical protein [Thalassolituus oleivorans 4BN06-13]|tara:strand:+ start:199 stop:1269 length:1071 start_codon:yes stop_codon:yes gene_type:complete
MPVWQHTGLTLDCYPKVPAHVSLPWDAADEYLLEHCNHSASISTLLLNDRHGALSCALPHAASYNDSASGRIATQRNRALNHSAQADFVDSPVIAQQVLIKIPKNWEQLLDQLALITAVAPTATVYLAGMAKHIPVSWLQWLEQNASRYVQYKIVRKARLIELTPSESMLNSNDRFKGYKTESGLNLSALPGVFARQQMDIGTRVMLEHLPNVMTGTVCDLGCGNGLLALSIKQKHPETRVIATDDSLLAVESARRNAEVNDLSIDVRHGNILQAVEESLDWVVCNPPFHDGHKQLTNIAEAMFLQSQQQLNPGGTLLVIANRHLPYLAKLKSLFASVDSLSSDKRFVVYECRKRS